MTAQWSEIASSASNQIFAINQLESILRFLRFLPLPNLFRKIEGPDQYSQVYK